jgi:hypothetical protein
MMRPWFRVVLLGALLAVVTLALEAGSSLDQVEAQASRHEFRGLAVDEDRRPVERLLVAASVQGEQGRPERRTTAAGGAFRLGLVEGTYRLSVWSDTHSKCTVSGIENPDSRPEAVFAVEGRGVTPIRIVVTTSDRTQSARWVRCYFDVPFYQVEGVVLGPKHEPLEGIDVRLYGRSSDNKNSWTDKATGPDGRFVIDVPEDSYRLYLTAELKDGSDCVLGIYGAERYRVDSQSAPGDTTWLEVTDKDLSGVVVTLEEVPSKLCHDVEVVVMEGGGELPDLVTFNFFRVLQAATVPHTATTNAEGMVKRPLLRGTYRLSIWSDTYDKCTVSGIENPEGRPDAEFSLEGGGTSHIGIVVTASGRGEGARWVRCNFDVPFHQIRGTVLGPDQQPLEGINVRLSGLSSEHNLGPWAGELTGADGGFSIEVPRGSYHMLLSAELEDGGTCNLGNYGADGQRAPSWDGTRLVVTDQIVPVVNITLANTPPSLCHEVRGVVADITGNPLADLPVSFGRVAGAGGETQVGRTGATGTFSVRLLDGSYWLNIWSGTYSECTVRGVENPESRLRAVLALAGESIPSVRIVVATRERLETPKWVPCNFDIPFYRIQGTVRGPGQEPLEGIDVRLHGRIGDHNLGPWTGEATGPDGLFTIEAPQGSYRLELSTELEGGGTCVLGSYGNDGRRAPAGAVTRHELEAGGIGGIAIVLLDSPSAFCREVQGVVTDAEGKPLAGMSLNFKGHGESQTPETGETGGFRLHVREGSYRVWIRTDAGSDCRIEGYESEAPGRGNSIVVDGRGVRGLRLVLFGRPRSATTYVKCPYPETVTTDLEPGWNLAGWTGPETDVASVFDSTPELRAIYAWDEEDESFRGAIRQESKASGSLAKLEPGVGLWLFIEGTERVSWTRPFLSKSALVSLADGWNLVSWGGRDGATAEDIFNSLGAEPVVAATWDASRGQFLLTSTSAPAGARPELQVRRGDALWLQTPGEERWLQPGWPAPDVVLAGNSHYYDYDGYLQLIREAQVFFAERYGAITSDVTFYFVSNREALEDTYSRERGISPSPGLCADYASQVIFIATYRCFPIAHEYFHAIQEDLAGNDSLGSPTWIVEGSALYTDFQQRYSKGRASYLPGQRFTWATYGPEVTLETASSLLSYGDQAWLGYTAFEWLAREVGEAAIIEYFALLKPSDTWEDAFQGAFGLVLEDFYTRFEKHRREVAPPFEWVVTGTILDRDAQPAEGLNVWVTAYVEGRLTSNLLTPVGPDGSFVVEHAPGSGYALLMAYNCPGGARREIGGYGQTGFTTEGRNALPFAGEDRDRRDLIITLPMTLAELERAHCA